MYIMQFSVLHVILMGFIYFTHKRHVIVKKPEKDYLRDMAQLKAKLSTTSPNMLFIIPLYMMFSHENCSTHMNHVLEHVFISIVLIQGVNALKLFMNTETRVNKLEFSLPLNLTLCLVMLHYNVINSRHHMLFLISMLSVHGVFLYNINSIETTTLLNNIILTVFIFYLYKKQLKNTITMC